MNVDVVTVATMWQFRRGGRYQRDWPTANSNVVTVAAVPYRRRALNNGKKRVLRGCPLASFDIKTTSNRRDCTDRATWEERLSVPRDVFVFHIMQSTRILRPLAKSVAKLVFPGS
jgi:hypothetical protein